MCAERWCVCDAPFFPCRHSDVLLAPDAQTSFDFFSPAFPFLSLGKRNDNRNKFSICSSTDANNVANGEKSGAQRTRWRRRLSAPPSSRCSRTPHNHNSHITFWFWERLSFQCLHCHVASLIIVYGFREMRTPKENKKKWAAEHIKVGTEITHTSARHGENAHSDSKINTDVWQQRWRSRSKKIWWWWLLCLLWLL